LLTPDLLGSIRLRGNYQGMLHQCTKLSYVTNVELIVMSDPGVLSLRKYPPRKIRPHTRYLAPKHQGQQQKFVSVKHA
jgi:hypothetical protein